MSRRDGREGRVREVAFEIIAKQAFTTAGEQTTQRYQPKGVLHGQPIGGTPAA
jgi:hypothetical protein